MRLCRGVVAALVGLAPSVAHAQYVEGRASVMLAGGYSAIVADAPAPAALSFAGPSLSITPMFALTVETARTNNVVGYAFTLSAPVAGQPTTYVNRLDYTGRYDLDGLTTMVLVAGASASPLNSLVVSQDSADTPIAASPAGSGYLVSASVRESLTRYLSGRVTITQSTSGTFADPFGAKLVLPRSYGLTNGLSVARLFARDTLSFGVSVDVNRITASGGGPGDPAPPVPARTLLFDTAQLTWMRTLRESLSLTTGLGVVHALNAADSSTQAVQPTGFATLTYGFGLAAAMAAYSHQAGVNPTTGTPIFADALQVRGSLPIGVTGLVPSATLGFSHVTPMGDDDPLMRPTNIFLADAGLAYYPERFPRISFGLRGQIQRQAVTSPPPDPIPGFVTGGSRYAVSLSVTYSYPNAASAMVRPALGPLGGSTLGPFPELVPSTPLGEGSYDAGELGAPRGEYEPEEP